MTATRHAVALYPRKCACGWEAPTALAKRPALAAVEDHVRNAMRRDRKRVPADLRGRAEARDAVLRGDVLA